MKWRSWHAILQGHSNAAFLVFDTVYVFLNAHSTAEWGGCLNPSEDMSGHEKNPSGRGGKEGEAGKRVIQLKTE